MIEALIEFLEQFNNEISVTFLEDNKYVLGDKNRLFTKDTLVREIANYNFSIEGSNDKEIYINIRDKHSNPHLSLTMQVSNIQFEDELNF